MEGNIKPPLSSFDAVGIVEGWINAESEDQVIEAWQLLHSSGLAYKLQGSLGRQAQALLEKGVIS
jgi:hypothetical protein